MNNDKNVSSKTREKIEKIIKEYNYTPSNLAINLTGNNKKNIVLIIPDIKNQFFSSIVDEFSKICLEYDYNLIIENSLENIELELKILKKNIANKYFNIILIPTIFSYENLTNNKDYKNYLYYIKDNFNLIILDRKLNDDFTGIYLENEKIVYNGCKKYFNNLKDELAIITGPLFEKNSIERYNGFLKFVNENNIKYSKYEGDFSKESGIKIFSKLNRNIKNIVICNNTMTIGFLENIIKHNEKGYKIFSFEEIENIELFNIKNVYCHKIDYKKIVFKCFKEIENKI